MCVVLVVFFYICMSVGCCMSGVCCLLFVVCCSLCGGRYLVLRAGCWLLVVVCWLSIVGCLSLLSFTVLFGGVRDLLYVVCGL